MMKSSNDETRMTKATRMTNSEFVLRASSFIRISGLVILVCVVGCSSNKRATTRPSNDAYDRQQAALKDPFDYSPNMNQDISGGDIGHMDRKAMRKDIDDVLNP